MAAAATSTVNMLSKVGADLRWFLEREGVDPERCVVSIGVPDEVAVAAVSETFRRDYVAGRMERRDDCPLMIVAHGVRMAVVARSKKLPPP